MREIKFRAWMKDQKEMCEVLMINFQNNHIGVKTKDYNIIQVGSLWKYTQKVARFDDVELMQYTGLKDKNGVEIYEGDILRVLNDNIGEYECGEVVMGGLGLWAIRLCGLKVPVFEFIDNRLSIVHSTERIEVIGNIYENPELLEVE
jgi:uncharacterized phage protein (TIGR01671 family)